MTHRNDSRPAVRASTTSSATAWDVVIAGAGPAGTVAARVLAAKGRRVLVIDRERHPSRRIVGESLPGAARKVLRDVGLLHVLTDGPHVRSAGTASAWEDDTLNLTDALRNPDGPGWHLDRERFNNDLCNAANEAGAVFQSGLVRGVQRDENDLSWAVSLTDGTVRARWVIDASGRAAVIGRTLGAVRHTGPPLVALARWSRPGTAPTSEQRTTVEAVPNGWWYTAPLPDASRVAVLHVRPEQAQQILQSKTWEERLVATRHIQPLLSGATWEAPPRGAKAAGAWTEAPGGAGWLAVGDAALSFDPISSQGLFNALYTGLRGAQSIDAALHGCNKSVQRYIQRLRRVHVAYLRRWRDTYTRQRRWTQNTFWQQRQPAPTVSD